METTLEVLTEKFKNTMYLNSTNTYFQNTTGQRANTTVPEKLFELDSTIVDYNQKRFR